MLARGDRLLVATHNRGKLEEIADLLGPFDVTVTGAGDLGLPEPEETETTFVGNARQNGLQLRRGQSVAAAQHGFGELVGQLAAQAVVCNAKVGLRDGAGFGIVVGRRRARCRRGGGQEVAAVGFAPHQPLLSQQFQRLVHGRARHAQPVGQPLRRQVRAHGEFLGADEFDDL